MSNSLSPAAAVRRWLPDVLLVAFAAAMTIFAAQFITSDNFWLDEFFSIEMVGRSWAEIPAATAGDVHPPLYYYILKLFVSVLGSAHAVYRIASFASYLLTVGMALVLFRPAFGRWAAFFFLCLMAPGTASLRYFTEARMYGWALFFVLLCGFAAYRLLADAAPKRRWWVTLTLSGLCAGYLHYFALLAVCFVYLALLVYAAWKRRPLLKGWGIAAAVSVVCYLPWAVVAAGHLMQQATGGFWLQQVPELSETLEMIVSSQLSGWAALALLGLGCVVYLFWPRDEAPARRWLTAAGLLAAVGVPAVGYAASALLRPMYLSRYFFPALGLLWLAMAVAADGLIRRLPRFGRLAAHILLAALVLYAMYEPAVTRQQELEQTNAVVAQAVGYVEDRIQPGDKVYSCVELVDDRVLEFYFPGSDHAAGSDPAAALPETGGSLFLIFPEEDPAGDWAAALEGAGLQPDSWQGALLNNQWCRIYHYVPAA